MIGYGYLSGEQGIALWNQFVIRVASVGPIAGVRSFRRSLDDQEDPFTAGMTPPFHGNAGIGATCRAGP